jgi:virulence-associated protein VapD
VGQYEKLLMRILSGTSDRNIMFSDLQKVLERLGFSCRIKGDHFIYTKDGVEEIINLQPINDKAKAYQVKQVRNIILNYKMGGTIDEV